MSCSGRNFCVPSQTVSYVRKLQVMLQLKPLLTKKNASRKSKSQLFFFLFLLMISWLAAFLKLYTYSSKQITHDIPTKLPLGLIGEIIPGSNIFGSTYCGQVYNVQAPNSCHIVFIHIVKLSPLLIISQMPRIIVFLEHIIEVHVIFFSYTFGTFSSFRQ